MKENGLVQKIRAYAPLMGGGLGVCVAVSVAVLALFLRAEFLQGMPMTTDENAYQFQARLFARGRIRHALPPLPGVLEQHMLIADSRAGWLSRYPPGHALWLVPGVWAGNEHLMVALAAALTVLAMCRSATALRLPLGAVLLPLVASPFFLMVHASLLSHGSGVMWSAFLFAGLSVAATRKTSGGWILAGVAWSMLFLNRTYTAVLLIPPLALFALFHAWALYRGRSWRAAGVQLLAFGLPCLAGVGLYLGYNRVALGEWGVPTYLYYSPSQGLGFGLRDTEWGQGIVHTPARGLASLWLNLRSLNRWLLPVPGAALLCAFLGVLGWRKAYTPLLAGSCFMVMAGAVYFWFPGIQTAGPIYWAELLPPLVLLSAGGLARIHRSFAVRLPAGALWVPGLLLTLFTVMAAALFFRRVHPEFDRMFGPAARYQREIAALPEEAVVVLHASDHLELYSNPEGLDSRPLVVKPLGDHSLTARAFPGRPLYEYRVESGEVRRLDGAALGENPVRVRIPVRVLHRRVGIPISDRSVFTTTPETSAGYLAFGERFWLPPGHFRLRSVFGSEAPPAGSDSRLEAGLHDQHRLEGLEVWSPSDPAAEIFMMLDRFTLVEPRYYHGGGHAVALEAMVIEELPDEG